MNARGILNITPDASLPRDVKMLAAVLNGWLFPGYRDSHITSRQVQNILDGIATRAGLQEVKRQDKAGKNRHRIHPHVLRHSLAVWSLDGSVPGLQDQLGHASLVITCIYLKVSPNHRREAYMRSKLPGFLEGEGH